MPISLRNKSASRDPEVARARLAALTTRPPAIRADLPASRPAAGPPSHAADPPSHAADPWSRVADPPFRDGGAALTDVPLASPETLLAAGQATVAAGSASRLGGWLPPALRTARVVAPRQAVAGLLAVALAAALLTALVMWRARPRATMVGPPPVLSAGRTTGPGSPPGSAAGLASAAAASAPPTGAAGLVVSVVGKVRHPGLVTLPAGARVADALRLADPLPGVDLTMLNLARKLTDGEQVVVGVPAAAPPAAGGVPVPSGDSGATPAAPVNLNTATLSDLDALPGVGPVIAQRILDWRSAHGGFASVDQLGEVSGIGDSTLERLRPLVTV